MGKGAPKPNNFYDLGSNDKEKYVGKQRTSTSKLYAVVAVPVFPTKIGSMFLVGKGLRGVESCGKERTFKTLEEV